MRSLIAALRSIVLPNGVTTGQRIVLDGVNGDIFVYDVNNNLIASITPASNAGQWVGGVAVYDYPAPGAGSYVRMISDLIEFGAWNGRQAFVRNGLIQVDDSGLTNPAVVEMRAPSDDAPNGHSAALELDSQYNNGVSTIPPVAMIYDNSVTVDVAVDLIVTGITYGRDRTLSNNGLFGTPVRESWHNIAIGGTWTQDTGSLPFSCRVTSTGFVKFRGGILAGTRTNGTVIGTVPAAFKPAKDLFQIAVQNGVPGVARILIRAATGNMEIYDVAAGAVGLTFEAAGGYPHPDMQ